MLPSPSHGELDHYISVYRKVLKNHAAVLDLYERDSRPEGQRGHKEIKHDTQDDSFSHRGHGDRSNRGPQCGGATGNEAKPKPRLSDSRHRPEDVAATTLSISDKRATHLHEPKPQSRLELQQSKLALRRAHRISVALRISKQLSLAIWTIDKDSAHQEYRFQSAFPRIAR